MCGLTPLSTHLTRLEQTYLIYLHCSSNVSSGGAIDCIWTNSSKQQASTVWPPPLAS